MEQKITLLEKAAEGNYEYDVFEFKVDKNNKELPVKFNKKRVKSIDTLIRVGEGIMGEVSENGVKKPIMSAEVFGYFDMINKLRADKKFKGEFILEAANRNGEVSYRITYRVQ